MTAVPANEIDFSELVARWAKAGPDAGSVTHVLEAGAALANAIHHGMGPMIRGTFMEADFRNALKLRDGETVNFRRSRASTSSAPSAARHLVLPPK